MKATTLWISIYSCLCRAADTTYDSPSITRVTASPLGGDIPLAFTSPDHSWRAFGCPASPTDYPVGIYLGSSKLTSAHFDASDHPITIASVEANREWSSYVIDASRDGMKDCWNSDHPYPDPIAGNCGEILPAFLDVMHAIVDVTSRHLGRPITIGLVSIPHNLTYYIPTMNQVMREVFHFEDRDGRSDDNIEQDILRHTTAAQLAYNLTNPEALDAPWAPHGRAIWDFWGESRLDDVFADEDNYMLVVNFEPLFLEMSYHCVQFACEQVPKAKLAFLELVESQLREEGGDGQSSINVQVPLNLAYGTLVGRLSSAIATFVNQTGSASLPRERLRAVVVMGGASEAGMDALRMALTTALPYLDGRRHKTTKEAAYIPSLGAALLIRNKSVGWDKSACNCEFYGPAAGFPCDRPR